MTEMPPTVTVAPVPMLPPTGLRQRLLDWIKQPTTQRGLGLAFAGVALAALHPFVGSEAIGASLVAGGFPMLLPDNSTDLIKTRDLANAIAHLAATRSAADVPAIVADVAAAVSVIEGARS